MEDVASVLQTLNSLDYTSFKADPDRKKVIDAARKLCGRLENSIETMVRLAWVEPVYAATLKTALDMGLIKAIGKDGIHGRHKLEDLAKETNSEPKLTGMLVYFIPRLQLTAAVRLLRMLAALDTIEEVDEWVYSPTKFSLDLLKPEVGAAINFRQGLNNPGFQHFPQFLKDTNYRNPESVLKSAWQPALKTDLPFFEWLKSQPELFQAFMDHMAGYSSQRGTWEAIYPTREKLLSNSEDQMQDILLVDLGGGSGHDLKRFADKYAPPHAKLVLQDLPEVIDVAKSKLPPNIEAVAIDLTKNTPVLGARAYFTHSLLECWPDEDVINILQNIRPALVNKTKDGYTPRLLINENIVPEKGASARVSSLDLLLCVAFSGVERTERQWREVLKKAGYEIQNIYTDLDATDESIIEAVVIS